MLGLIRRTLRWWLYGIRPYDVQSHKERTPRRAPPQLLVAGDNLWISGGYDLSPKGPEWLAGGEGYSAKLVEFVPGQTDLPAALVRFEPPVELQSKTYPWGVLEIRHVGARWFPGAIVHVELCDFEPERKPWAERRQGDWVESHATVTRRT